MVAYFDGPRKVTVAHRYLFPDGRVGGPVGLPDPKMMVCCGVMLYTAPP